LPTAWAGESRIGSGGEHFGEANATEAMAAVEEQRGVLFFVVLGAAHRATGDPPHPWAELK
jgi:hypothetical protein